MAKGFKLRISLSSLRICRSKKPSALAKSPTPTPPIFTSVNPKVWDITYPKLPAPPSTPNHQSKSILLGSGSFSKLSTIYVSSSSNMASPAYSMKKEHDTFAKLCNSPVSEEFEENMWSMDYSQAEKNTNKDPMTSFTMSISSADSYLFSSDQDVQNDEESEGLLSSACSSLDSSYDFGYGLKTNSENPTYVSKRKKKNSKVRKLKRYVSNSWKYGEKIALATNRPEISESAIKKTVFERLMPCMVDGKVNESYAVMKKSADPYDDFKKSMLEMILEKQISEAEDLEKLLMCFLSLNAKEHHAVIVEAFTEVWEELFSSNPK